MAKCARGSSSDGLLGADGLRPREAGIPAKKEESPVDQDDCDPVSEWRLRVRPHPTDRFFGGRHASQKGRALVTGSGTRSSTLSVPMSRNLSSTVSTRPIGADGVVVGQTPTGGSGAQDGDALTIVVGRLG